MVYPAAQAISRTTSSIATTNSNNLIQEITRCETNIQTAANQGFTSLVYNATTIGNPPGPPTSSNLTSVQLEFFQDFQQAGYNVSQDPATGYWLLDWAETGYDALVDVYLIYTSSASAPANSTAIQGTIQAFFASLVPVLTCTTSYIASNSTITQSTFVAVVAPQSAVNSSSALLTALTAITPYGINSGNTLIEKT